MVQNEELREHFCILGQQGNPNLMLTLTTNKDWNAAKMKMLVGQFFGRLDRCLLGCAWLERPIEDRIDGMAFVEKPNVNVHAHCVVKLKMDHWYNALRKSKTIWDKLCPSGEVEFEPISYSRDALNYCLKETEGDHYKFDDQIILLREFHPHQ